MASVRLIAKDVSVTETTTFSSVNTQVFGDFAASVAVAGLALGKTFDVKIQESPDPFTVDDADAVWYDLVTFTQLTTVAPKNKQEIVGTPHFTRMRVVATLSAATSGNLNVLIEGVQI